MESKEVTISDIFSEATSMVEILKWFKKGGENIFKGELLLEVIIDSEIIEIVSPWSGTIAKINVNQGEIATPKNVIAIISIR